MKARTSEEIRTLVNHTFGGIVADVMSHFPTVRKAINGVGTEAWKEFVDEKCDTLYDSFLTFFGVNDGS